MCLLPFLKRRQPSCVRSKAKPVIEDVVVLPNIVAICAGNRSRHQTAAGPLVVRSAADSTQVSADTVFGDEPWNYHDADLGMMTGPARRLAINLSRSAGMIPST